MEYIDRKVFEFEGILRLLSLLNGEEGEEEVEIFSKIMRLYKSNKEKERKKDFDSVSLKFEVKKVESRKVKSKRESFKKFTLFNFTYYYYYSIPSLFFHHHSGNLANNLQIEKARKRAPIIGRQSMKLARAER